MIVSRKQFKNMTPEQIVDADEAGQIDYDALAAERMALDDHARRRRSTIASHLAHGGDPEIVPTIVADYETTRPDR